MQRLRTTAECQQERIEHRSQRLLFLTYHRSLHPRDLQTAEDVAQVQDFHDVWDDYQLERG